MLLPSHEWTLRNQAGMMAFGSCFGNTQADQQVFQIDDFAHYRQIKLLARAERLSKYYQTCNYSLAVAGMEKINRRGDAIAHTMITHKPMLRFAWGLSTDTRLNHHPEAPPGVSVSQWQGRNFDPQRSQLYLQIEPQVIWGLPEYEAALFSVRTYFRDCGVVKKDQVLRSKLYAAIQSMTPKSLIYKGLVESKTSILEWLEKS
ncbi:heme-dependent oxidative N-demethylase subunit alpha family protein [Nostoc sp.]|uniref:heme-dependent oxidative N-demethylase subunit alpha family protein n=1 Tax=Nostoc sp. TaxID=1180 RepID=UPI002FFAF088